VESKNPQKARTILLAFSFRANRARLYGFPLIGNLLPDSVVPGTSRCRQRLFEMVFI